VVLSDCAKALDLKKTGGERGALGDGTHGLTGGPEIRCDKNLRAPLTQKSTGAEEGPLAKSMGSESRIRNEYLVHVLTTGH